MKRGEATAMIPKPQSPSSLQGRPAATGAAGSAPPPPRSRGRFPLHRGRSPRGPSTARGPYLPSHEVVFPKKRNQFLKYSQTAVTIVL